MSHAETIPPPTCPPFLRIQAKRSAENEARNTFYGELRSQRNRDLSASLVAAVSNMLLGGSFYSSLRSLECRGGSTCSYM